MRKLPKPTDDVEDVFGDCISNIKNDEFKRRLESCKDEIACATIEFEEKAIVNQIHTITSRNNVAGNVTNDEMTKVYTEKMAKKSAPGRKYYDKYLSAPRNGICPLCGQRIASTLDHYLPKKKYPALAVTPVNLIPACKDCNKDKGEKEFTSSSEETIHPYFDDIENEPWLFAKIIEDNDIAIIFYVEKPEIWTDTLFKRVKRHFEIFNLNALYSAHAAEELININYALIKVYKFAGLDGVRDYLKEFWESSEKANKNSWKTAMFRALYENQWFSGVWIKSQI
jgi:5-methylcytosine-specific restriction endonuclease McrA